MVAFAFWYIAIITLGFLFLPLTRYLLPRLPDKGYTFSRILGLLLSTVFFWLLASYKVLQNDIGGVLAAIGLVFVAGWIVSKKSPVQVFLDAWKSNRGLVILTEMLFLVLFGLMALWRSANPDLTGTEKPMELAFINAILKSPAFPPADPWLSGYSISYYYLGYVMTAVMIRLTGVAAGTGFNLMVSLVFSLTGIGIYGLAYNITSSERFLNWIGGSRREGTGKGGTLVLPLLAPLFTLVISNLEGVLEFLHSRGFFWTSGQGGSLVSGFWKWLDIQELVNAPAMPVSAWPNRPAGIIWWRASRVLSDYNFSSNWLEVIDEFPFFSFLLSDLHPHVLALPVATLLLAVSLNLLLPETGEDLDRKPMRSLKVLLKYGFYGILLGSLTFMNTWDFPVNFGIFLSAWLIQRMAGGSGFRQGLVQTVELAVVMVAGIFIFYLPFFTAFASQAGGFIPSYVFSTRGIHFWVMFGTLLIPVFLALGYLAIRQKSQIDWLYAIRVSIIAIGIFFLFSFGLGFLLSSFTGEAFSAYPVLQSIGSGFMAVQGASGSSSTDLLLEALKRRVVSPGTWLTIGLLVIVPLGMLKRQIKFPLQESTDENLRINYVPEAVFLCLILLAGALLTISPEFVYLRDQFGWRMNTIFKFYYQAWVLWSLAAGVCAAIILRASRGKTGIILRLAIALTMLAGVAYPLIGIPATTNNLNPGTLDLDGTGYMARYSPDEAEAIAWLKDAPYGTVVEAVGGSYSGYARVATMTGLPGVLGWPGHESQWRGGAAEMGNRQADIERMYSSDSWMETRQILEMYDIDYIFIGTYERSGYNLKENKFVDNLQAVFRNASVVIYAYQPSGNTP